MRLGIALLGTMMLVFAGGNALQGAAASSPLPERAKEVQLKAAYIYQFCRFIRWPASAEAQAGPLLVHLLDAQDVEVFRKTLAGKKVRGRSFKVEVQPDHVEDLQCHILFLNTIDKLTLRKWLALAKGKPVLVVGRSPGFAHAGGVINFYDKGGRLRFEINMDAAERAKLRISSQLLKLARIIRENR